MRKKCTPIFLLLFTAFLFLCGNLQAAAQNSVAGSIFNHQQEPLVEAIIALVKDADSTILTSALPDSSGKYTLLLPDTTGTSLMVSAMGYRTIYKRIVVTQEGLQHLDFTLEPVDASLGEVIVSAARPILERKVDRIIYNVSASIALAGGNTGCREESARRYGIAKGLCPEPYW